MARWRFETLDRTEIYVFHISPNEHASMVPVREITWQHSRAGFTGTRAGRNLHAWTFAGVLRDQAQYDALLSWVNKRTWIRLVTDLDQELIVRLQGLTTSRVAGARGRHAPWRQTYTMSVLTSPVLR